MGHSYLEVVVGLEMGGSGRAKRAMPTLTTIKPSLGWGTRRGAGTGEERESARSRSVRCAQDDNWGEG